MGGGGPAPVQAAPVAPAVDPVALAQQQQAAEAARLKASQGGRASTILTGPNGDQTLGGTASKMLLGN
jgi:hypothetical protein